MGRTASAFQLIRCPACGSLHSVSARHARRQPGRCRQCKKSKTEKTDYSTFWLGRFSDEEICYMAEAVFERPEGSASRALVASARSRVNGKI
jgi:hypothetical protein